MCRPLSLPVFNLTLQCLVGNKSASNAELQRGFRESSKCLPERLEHSAVGPWDRTKPSWSQRECPGGHLDRSVCGTLRLGFVRGLYEPPGGGEQQSHSQLSHRIGQHVRRVTHTDPSGAKSNTIRHVDTFGSDVSGENRAVRITSSSAPAKRDGRIPPTWC